MNTAAELKLELGNRYWRRDGLLSGTIGPYDNGTYKYMDMSTGATYSVGGRHIAPLERPEDLVRLADPSEYGMKSTENHEGNDLPDVAWISISAIEYLELQQISTLQADKIKRLQAMIDRKNKVFNEVLEIARYELAKEIE